MTGTQYHSAPYSLRAILNTNVFVTCKIPDTTTLFQGLINTWHYWATATTIYFFFRYPGENISLATGYYQVRLLQGQLAQLSYQKTGETYIVGTWNYPPPLTTWVRTQITWWWGSNMQGTWALAVELEGWDGANWVSYGVLYDVLDQNTEYGNSRVGFSLYSLNYFIDDTEIWKPI